MLSRTTTGPEPASTGEVSTGSDVTSASTISGLPTETTSTSTESTTTSTVTVAEVVTEGAPPPEGETNADFKEVRALFDSKDFEG